MNVLEKILEEINKRRCNLIDMSDEEPELCDVDDWYDEGVDEGKIKAYFDVEQIIRSYMNECKDMNIPSNNGWIPVSERLPEPDKIVYVTVHCSEWTSDYDSDWVAENEKVHHEEKYIVNVGYVDEDWHWTAFDDDGYEVCCDEEFGTDKGCVYSVVTAWLPLPEPYKGE